MALRLVRIAIAAFAVLLTFSVAISAYLDAAAANSTSLDGASPSELLGRSAGPNLLAPVGEIDGLAKAVTFEEARVLQPAAAFIFAGDASQRELASHCLATAAWYEAGDDPAGQRAVMQVILNRLHHPAFPKSVCGIVFQGHLRHTGCQFSFTCDGSMQRRTPSSAAWKRAHTLSELALSGTVDETVGQATHFHADYVDPWWRKHLLPVAKVGRHIFYTWHGAQGSLLSKLQGTAAEFAAPDPEGNLNAVSDTDVGEITQLTSNLVPPTGTRTAPTSISNTSRNLFAVDLSSSSGRWAISALEICNGKQPCTAIGYGREIIGDVNGLATSQLPRPAFVLVRDAASGMTVAMWDCERVERPKKSECLPQDGQQLRRIMRER